MQIVGITCTLGDAWKNVWEDIERKWVFMIIQRERWLLRTADGKILVGQPRNYEWRKLEDVGDARIATYMSEKKALSAVKSQGWVNVYDIYAERVMEGYFAF